MQRYFVKKDYEYIDPQEIWIEGEIFHHMTRVMRMKIDDLSYLVFNQEIVIQAKIIEINEDHLIMMEIKKLDQQTELPVNVTLFCGFPKGDKLELITQKSTELGAHAIIGFPSKTSIVKWNEKKRRQKQERLAKIALEAAEQSHRSLYPEVTLMGTFQEMLEALKNYDHVLIAFEEAAKQGEQGQLVKTLTEIKAGESLAFVFGPEGGLLPEEIEKFETLGAKVCALGPRILRTETAPFYALSAVSYQLELK